MEIKPYGGKIYVYVIVWIPSKANLTFEKELVILTFRISK